MTSASSSFALRAIALLDLTELGDQATPDDVAALCRRALGPYGTVAAVCVWPRHVTQAATLLAGQSVRVATVVNFPGGDDSIDDVIELARDAMADGADEIDVVLPYHALLAGDLAHPAAMVAALRDTVAGGDRRMLKVILETGKLVDPAIIRTAAELAIRNGADFIKTSTGKTPVSATVEAAEVMLQVIHDLDPTVGIKPSGGIRTVADAARFLALADRIMGDGWATSATFRFGASGLLTALEAAVQGDDAVAGTDAY